MIGSLDFFPPNRGVDFCYFVSKTNRARAAADKADAPFSISTTVLIAIAHHQLQEVN